MDPRGRPLVIAHRGHSVGAPELTLAAFTKAISHGADMIEADVRLTKDGHLVLMHDATVDRTTNGTGAVADFRWAEIRRLDAGGWFDDRFTGEPVASVSELMDLAAESDLALCLEAKGESAAERLDVALAVAEVLERTQALERHVLASFDHHALARAAGGTPGLRTAPDRNPERGLSRVVELVRQARDARSGILQHHHRDLTREVVGGLHDQGIEVWAWPTTAMVDIMIALSLGVDAVMGDDVFTARAVVGAHLGDAGNEAARGTDRE